MAILCDMLEELLILLRRPQALPELLLVAARVPPHSLKRNKEAVAYAEDGRSRREERWLES